MEREEPLIPFHLSIPTLATATVTSRSQLHRGLPFLDLSLGESRRSGRRACVKAGGTGTRGLSAQPAVRSSRSCLECTTPGFADACSFSLRAAWAISTGQDGPWPGRAGETWGQGTPGARVAPFLPPGSGSPGAHPSLSSRLTRNRGPRPRARAGGSQRLGPRAHIPAPWSCTSQKPDRGHRTALSGPASRRTLQHPARTGAPLVPRPRGGASPGPAGRGWAGRPASPQRPSRSPGSGAAARAPAS